MEVEALKRAEALKAQEEKAQKAVKAPTAKKPAEKAAAEKKPAEKKTASTNDSFHHRPLRRMYRTDVLPTDKNGSGLVPDAETILPEGHHT